MLAVSICNRTNYSKLKPVLEHLPPEKFGLILSSSILLEQYGNAYQDIEEDGFPIVAKIDCLLASDQLESMIKTISISMIEHNSVFSRIQPTGLLIVGDRFDILPSVLAAKIMNIPIFHIQGGERSGSIDDYIRKIVSICADRHYVATEKSKIQVEKLTQSSRVYNTGCPAVEKIASLSIDSDITHLHKQFKDKISIEKNEKYFLIVVHPNTIDKDIDMNIILEASLTFNAKCILFYPNADSFHEKIINAIRRRKAHDKLILIKHAPLEDFAKLMAHSSCMIGNSSAGIREAASFGTPVVNIGTRQKNRERNTNTIDVMCHKSEIISAINKSLSIGRYPTNNIYYKPNAAKNIANNLLSTIPKTL